MRKKGASAAGVSHIPKNNFMIMETESYTVCFFSTATKDDAITQLIQVSLISAMGHF